MELQTYGFLVLSTGIGDAFEVVAFVFYLVMDGVKSFVRSKCITFFEIRISKQNTCHVRIQRGGQHKAAWKLQTYGFLVLSTGIGDVFEVVAFVFYLVMDGVKSLGRKREYIETHTRSAEKYIS
jgi:hypothetical protein